MHMSHPWGLYNSSLLAVGIIVGVFLAVYLSALSLFQPYLGGEIFLVCIHLKDSEICASLQLCNRQSIQRSVLTT